ncbi:hypothetical protein BH10PSE7_BH10PSE7_41910 [soil metagenome]
MQTAQIITFRKPAINISAARLQRGPAQIIMFPGVQYIRIHDDGDTISIATAPHRASKHKLS